MIAIIDFGMGNHGSIMNMLRKVGAESVITSDPGAILSAEKLVLPGVGAFDVAMKNLHDLNLVEVLEKAVIDKGIPVLGICLGMQILTTSSQEGSLPGLGWIDAETKSFHEHLSPSNLRIPHMGWNGVDVKLKRGIFQRMYDEPRYYFVHSYFVECSREENVLATTHYGMTFHSAIMRDNIVGTQFHPEKSHKFGLLIFKNFVEG